MTASARYLLTLLAVSGIALILILALNLQLGVRALGGAEATKLASAWQQQSKGVTYAPPITASRRFKALRLADRMPGIDAVAFGSSTAWGITAADLPDRYRFYNFATTGNPLVSIIGEAQYLLAQYPDQWRLMVVPLEWAIGSIFEHTSLQPVDLSTQAVLDLAGKEDVPLWRKMQDALSYPKVVSLVQALKAITVSPDPWVTAQSTFSAMAGAEYHCADGTIARDFDVVNQGRCAGFRFDGSWSFGGEKRLSTAQAATLSRAAAAPSSKFFRSLCATHGEPNAAYLQALEVLAEQLGRAGGQMLFLLPPLVPGLEAAVAANPAARACLDRAKAVLHDWAQRNNTVILDAGRSERYGCVVGEFIDEHHAYPECYRRVLVPFFRAQHEGRVQSGLLQP